MWLETDNSLVNLTKACEIERGTTDDDEPCLLIHFPQRQIRRRTLTAPDEAGIILDRLQGTEGLIRMGADIDLCQPL